MAMSKYSGMDRSALIRSMDRAAFVNALIRTLLTVSNTYILHTVKLSLVRQRRYAEAAAGRRPGPSLRGMVLCCGCSAGAAAGRRPGPSLGGMLLLCEEGNVLLA